MVEDWCPSIREFCRYWQHAPTLQMTFQALENALKQENDACIGAAKGFVECACKVLITELDDPSNPETSRPDNVLNKAAPALSEYLSTTVRMLNLSGGRNDAFNKIISAHNKLAESLNKFRNEADPASHGKNGFVERLSKHHHRIAVLSADSIIAYLHGAYQLRELDPRGSLEPYERFEPANSRIDSTVLMELVDDSDDATNFIVRFGDRDREGRPMTARVSQLLFAVDRNLYKEAQDFALSIPDAEIYSEAKDSDD